MDCPFFADSSIASVICRLVRASRGVASIISVGGQRRGLHRKEYAGATLRENLGLPMPRTRLMT